MKSRSPVTSHLQTRLAMACVIPGLAVVVLATSATSASTTDVGWLQWGGPDRNFIVESARLADTWPADGPRRSWQRPLGEGHSTILADGDRLYTMYRPVRQRPQDPWADEEIVVALDEASGRTIWEHRYEARALDFRFGAGPHSTPLLVGDRLFVSGTNNQLFALDKHTGDVLWSHDLVREFGAQEALIRPAVKAGMSISPLAWRDAIIVLGGGRPNQSVMAFDQATGRLVWTGGDFNVAQASPILIDVDGQPQVVAFGGMDVNGLDPDSGRVLWSHPHDTNSDMNISTPLWGPDNLLFITSGYDHGSRMLRLTRDDAGTRVDERWYSRSLRVQITTSLRIDDFVVGSNGDSGPVPLTALDTASGVLLWQDRRFARANLMLADGKLLILDEDGILGLARASRDGLEVLARAEVLAARAWTAPTLVGSRLYVRDRRTIMKLELPIR